MIPRYDCPEISFIWSEPYKYMLWTKIELTFLKYLKGVDIPCPTDFRQEWIAQIAKIEDVTRHDVAAFVEWLEGYVRDMGHEDAARYVHYGLTSSDVLDTTFSLQIMMTNYTLFSLAEGMMTALAMKVRDYSQTEMLGRTHGQAAERILFRSKLDAWGKALSIFTPHGKRPYYGKLSGAVGDSKYFSPEVAQSTLEELGLSPSPLTDGQIIHRAVFCSYMNEWAVLASVIGKIATDIRLLSQSEIREVQEGFGKGQVGSSSMPQKRNPIFSENLCGLARTIRGYQTTAMQNVELWNERDISHSSAERMVFPDAATLLGFMVKRMTKVFAELQVNEDMMRRNLNACADQIESQAAMLKMIDKGMSRKEAHAAQRKAQGL